MKVGIIGRTASGRSTLFEGLTGLAGTRTANRPRLGIARVWDPRVDRLTEICQPKKTVFAELSLVVPPGSMDAMALREMRDLKTFVHVIGAFAGEPVEQTVLEQINELKTDLVLADMERVEKRLARIKKGGGDRPGEMDALTRAASILEGEKLLRQETWDEQATTLLDELGLLSHRQVLTVVNVSEELASEAPPPAVLQALQAIDSQLLWLCASLELEISQLDAEAQTEFLAEYGLSAPVSQRFAHACLSLLNQVCFFTVGPDEVRAWPIPRDTVAKRAARTIHSDLEKGFIRAEVIDYETFVELGSESKARDAGKLRVEGKDYIVQDGDIINVRFNV